MKIFSNSKDKKNTKSDLVSIIH